MAGFRWSETEDSVLITHWRNFKKSELMELLPGRTWAAVLLHAAKLGLTRDTTSTTVNTHKAKSYIDGTSKISALLEETPEAYYWAGFIAADGHISKRRRLRITLAQKDEAHLQLFCKFINANPPKKRLSNTGYGQCYISLQDLGFLPFTEKFNITSRKTYDLRTPNIPDDSLFLSFLAGFVDGDGGIRTLDGRSDVNLHLVGHVNSLSVFMEWADRFNSLIPSSQTNSRITAGSVPRIDSSGYVRWCISNNETIRAFKRSLLSLNLPLMARKWDLVDINKKSKYVLSDIRKQWYFELTKANFSRTEIAKVLGVGMTYTYRYTANRGEI